LRIGNELKIGITVVAAVLVGFFGFRVMKDMPIFRQGTVIFAKYDRVDGLSVGTPVLINGIKIGSVQRLTLGADDSVTVELNINMIDGVPVGSVAYIRSTDLLGSKGVEVVRAQGSIMIPYNGKIKGVFDEGLFGELAAKGGEISDNVNDSAARISSILSEFETVLRDGGRADLEAMLRNLERTTGDVQTLVQQTSGEITSGVAHLNRMLGNLDELTSEERGELQQMVSNLEKTSAELQEMSVSLNEMSRNMGEIVRKINEGEGTMGLLVNDPSLYQNLDSLSVNLNNLVKNLNDNPRHFMRHLRLVDVF
jgi:phospholipid/cholesterol/gamma-HCH transport system substrate-binding protein